MAMLAAHLPLRFGADLQVTRSSAARMQQCKSDGNRRVEPAAKNQAVSANSVDEEVGEEVSNAGSTVTWYHVSCTFARSASMRYCPAQSVGSGSLCSIGCCWRR